MSYLNQGPDSYGKVVVPSASGVVNGHQGYLNGNNRAVTENGRECVIYTVDGRMTAIVPSGRNINEFKLPAGAYMLTEKNSGSIERVKIVLLGR
jgi:hypothetical protein